MTAETDITEAINPTAPYTLAAARRVLCLRATSLKREIRQHRLRVSKRCGRYYILGEWLLEWIRQGEVTGLDDKAE